MKECFSAEKSLPTGKKSLDSSKKENFSKGFVQVYTGNGKGKTTASLGLALRAAGHGFNVLMVQFMKGGIDYGELKTAQKLSPHLSIIPMGRKNFVDKKAPDPMDAQYARKGWKLVLGSVQSNRYQIIILDEINVAIKYGLVSLEEVLDLIKNKPEKVELILTGRYAHPEITRCADLVTEMKEKKHYYKKGVTGRVGIER
jgi:cob(I)alamin adenosyltransferase